MLFERFEKGFVLKNDVLRSVIGWNVVDPDHKDEAIEE